MARQHEVVVAPLPPWLDAPRLLGPGGWQPEGLAWRCALDTHAAADLAARLRGLRLDGHDVEVIITPPLPRPAVRAARTEDARRRRDTTPGFTRPGTRLDEVGRYSLTPEAMAEALGRRAAGRTVLDAGCGAGGNTIGFARAGCRVVAVDADAARLADARHNASRYGVADRVRFVHGDAREVDVDVDLTFVDPPWLVGDRVAATLDDLPLLRDLLARGRTELWAKVPPGFEVRGVPQAAAEAWFGAAAGDHRRVKFVLLRVPPR